MRSDAKGSKPWHTAEKAVIRAPVREHSDKVNSIANRVQNVLDRGQL